MRALILVAGAALALSACSREDAADNTMNVDETMTTDNLTVDANTVNVVENADAKALNAAEEADLTNNTADTNVENGM